MEINEIETNRRIEKINETKNWFFEKINKTDKRLDILINKKRAQIPEMEEKVQLIPQTYRIIEEYYSFTPTNWTTYKKWMSF